MSKRIRTWHVRTVKEGRIKLLYHTYSPSERFLKYDGRLDGRRMLFGVYQIRRENGDEILRPFINLHSEDGRGPDDPDITCVEDSYPWGCWERDDMNKDASPRIQSMWRAFGVLDDQVCETCAHFYCKHAGQNRYGCAAQAKKECDWRGSWIACGGWEKRGRKP